MKHIKLFEKFESYPLRSHEGKRFENFSIDKDDIFNQSLDRKGLSDESYRLIEEKYSGSKLVMTDKDSIEIYVEEQKHGYKPRGIWYGIGTSWIDWVRNEMPEWEDEHVFKLDVSESKMLMIHTLEDLYSFTNKYGGSDGLIYWNLVANEYGGIEISPHIEEGLEFRWYRTWDVASGCIWNQEVIKNTEQIV